MPNAKIFMVVGINHILKKLEYQGHVSNKHQSTREYLNELVPNLNMVSVCQINGDSVYKVISGNGLEVLKLILAVFGKQIFMNLLSKDLLSAMCSRIWQHLNPCDIQNISSYISIIVELHILARNVYFHNYPFLPTIPSFFSTFSVLFEGCFCDRVNIRST